LWQPGKGLQEVLEKGKKMKWSSELFDDAYADFLKRTRESPKDKTKVEIRNMMVSY
jgi:hypothetical protein